LSQEEFKKEELLKSYLISDEKPYAILKSATEEYIFTDKAYISVKGNLAVGTKRNITRYEYFDNTFSHVALQTPGKVANFFLSLFISDCGSLGLGVTDLDGTLSFRLNGYDHSIDIRKPDWELINPLYRTLTCLSHAQRENASIMAYQRDILSKLYLNVSADPLKVKEMSFQVATEAIKTFTPSSYMYIWENHGKN
jgi:hypothetical protein